ncbi:unnamed protein product [Trichogramma brassicae]|uniref:Uncharacterized protein n=1 Tax=Trichogramma brassicae TaxID=86971 RepID=A0A6H5IND6_9HYME|nr:unnamed protein product [Trichogramma brassicae]
MEKDKLSETHHRRKIAEDHIALIKEPGSKYLAYAAPKSDPGEVLTSAVSVTWCTRSTGRNQALSAHLLQPLGKKRSWRSFNQRCIGDLVHQRTNVKTREQGELYARGCGTLALQYSTRKNSPGMHVYGIYRGEDEGEEGVNLAAEQHCHNVRNNLNQTVNAPCWRETGRSCAAIHAMMCTRARAAHAIELYYVERVYIRELRAKPIPRGVRKGASPGDIESSLRASYTGGPRVGRELMLGLRRLLLLDARAEKHLRIHNHMYIFKREQIDLFLVDSLRLDGSELQADKIIEFVIKTEYRDKPEVEKYSRKKLLHRNTPLHYLAKNECKVRDSVIKNLFTIYDCFDVNYYDDSGLTHFHAACKFGCVEVVEKFIEHGQDPNCYECESEEKYPRPPLHLALEYGSIRVAALLLISGADPNSVDEDGCTPLHVICQNGELLSQAREMERLFKCSNDQYPRVKVDARDNLGRTPMHYAVAQTEAGSLSLGRDNPISVLMEHGADPMAADAEGLTPLHIICQRDIDDLYADKFCDVLPSMALKETCVEVLDQSGNRPLHYALRGGLRGTVAALLRRGADANRANEHGETPAHVICERKEDDGLMEEFVVMNYKEASLTRQVSPVPLEVSSRNRWGQTPLHLAAANGLKRATETLLRNGADSNVTDSKGSTPLHLICTSKRNDDLAEIFFAINDEKQQLVKVNARDNSGNTPLHLALRHADRVLVVMLLRRGADPNAINHRGSTPLHFMCVREDDNDWLARIFFRTCGEMERTVKIDARDNRGRTPLELAVAIIAQGTVQCLLDSGADVSNFAFPSEIFPPIVIKDEFIDFSDEFKMILASCPLNILGHLKLRGYELDRSGALVVVKFFTRYQLFKMSSDVNKCLRCDARQTEEAETSDSESEEFENACIAAKSPEEACAVHKVENQTRKFFLELALEFFMEITRDRVPYLCSSLIMEQLRNRDLCNVCLAGATKVDPHNLQSDVLVAANLDKPTPLTSSIGLYATKSRVFNPIRMRNRVNNN